MNCAYRLIWNERINAWSVVPEIAKARGKGGAAKRSAAVLLLTLACASHAVMAADLAATALPGGAQVAAGQATVSTSGASMAINQSSQRAIINWQNFDIGSQAQVNFLQPNASAVALNRVSGPTASRIEGQLSANGQVFLVNPNGVLFGAGARVNVGALAVSTLNIRDEDFLGGNYLFTGSGGSITNQGQISAAPGGYLAFISPTITNSGTLSAPQGTVAMGAGERVRLNFAGDRLVGLDVSADTIDTLITNSQAIRAEGGAILLTAAGAEAVTRSAINNTGVLEAGSLTRDGGRIVLKATGDITLGATSTVAVDGQKGGEITLQAQSGTLLADGRIAARGAAGTGGTVRLLGHQVGLVNAAQVDASGATGGGTVLVGGDYQGGNTGVQNAAATFVASDARITADALQQGDGGKVIVWADGTTRYFGSISADGAGAGGNGGFVETSGKETLIATGQVSAKAPNGLAGTWLLDPNNITIQAAGSNTNVTASPNFTSTNDNAIVTTGSIQTALNAGTGVAVTTGSGGTNSQPGNITVASAIAKTAGGNATLTLNAANNIVFNTGANVTSTAGALGLTLNAGGAINTMRSISLNGGTLTVNATGAVTQSSAITGNTSVVKNGAGTFTLSQNNTYTGATNINAGTLVLGAANRIANTSAVTVGAGATFNLAGFAETVGSIAGGGNITLGAGTLTTGGNNASTAFSGGISGTGGLAKTGTGTLTLSGTNTYTGTTTISAGTLAVSGGSAIADTSQVTLANTAGAALNLAGNETIGNLAGGGTTGGNVVLNGNTVTVNETAATTYAGVISGAGGLTKQGAAALTLSGANTYTGTTTINAGTLQVGAGGTTGTLGTGAVIDNAALVFNRSNAMTVANAISGTGTVTKAGAGTTTLTGANTYSGTTTISAGTLQVGAGGTSGTLGTGQIIDNAVLSFNRSDALTVANVISGTGALTKAGTGTLTLSGTNAYAGATTVSAGTLVAASNTALGTTAGGTTVATGATLALQGDIAVGAETLTITGTGVGNNGALRNLSGNNTWGGTVRLSGNAEIQSDAGTLTLSAVNAVTNATATARSLTVDGSGNTAINGTITTTTGTLTKNGSGALSLSGANTYTGTTTINAGTLSYGANNAINSGAVVVNNGGIYDLNGYSDTIGALTVNSGTLGGTVTTGSGTLTLGGNVTSTGGGTNAVISGNLNLGAANRTVSTTNAADGLTISAVISGPRNLTKAGAGTLTLTGANTYTGVTTVSAGTLAFNSIANVGGGASALGAPTTAANGTIALAGGATLQYTGSGHSSNRVINLTSSGGTIDASGSGTLALSGGVTGAARNLILTGSGNGVESGVIGTTTGTLTKNGTGTWTLSGANTYTGATTINGGTLVAANAAALGTAAAGTAVNAGATLELSGTTTFAESIALNNATLAWSGGDPTLTGGVALTGSNVVHGAAGTLTLGGVVSGTGGFNSTGAGTLVAAGNNTYAGTTQISGGALRVTHANGLGATSGGTSVGSSGRLIIDGVAIGAEAVTLNGPGLFGAGAITSNGNASLAGPITLAADSVIAPNSGSVLTLTGTVNGPFGLTTAGSGTLNLNGAVGGGTPLAFLTTGATGATGINASVRTTGNQTYNNPTTLGGGVVLESTGGSLLGNAPVAATAGAVSLRAAVDVDFRNAGNDFSTVAVTAGGNVSLVDQNAIDLGASTVAGNLTLTAGGAVTDTGALAVTGATALTAGAANDITLDNANDFGGNVSITSGRTVRLNDINSLTLDLSGFGTLTATAGGTLTLAGGLTASGSGDAIVLSGSRFVNNAGGGALSAPGGRWLVWSSNPDPFGGATPDVRGGLAYGFKQYNAIYGTTTVLGSGNGFLYSLVPTITPGLTGTASKAYDGNTTATLTAGNFTATGAIDGDTVVLNATGATYDNKNVGSGKTITATGITASASNGTAAVYGYTVSPASASGAIGEITPATLTVSSIGAVGTTYGTPAATGMVTLNGVVTGDTVGSTASIVSPAYSTSGNLRSGSYAQTATTLSGADAGNYTLTSYITPTLNYTVGQLALTGTAIAAAGSTYGSPLNPGAVSFGNAIGGDIVGSTASVNTTTLSGSGNAIVGSYTQTAGALTGADAANYSFGGFTSASNYAITPLALTASSIAAVNATYGTPAAAGAVALSGVVAGDTVGSTASIVSPAYSTSGNLRAGAYAQTATTLGGADAGNYTLTPYTTPAANYTVGQLALTGGITADNKVYDGTTAATIASRSLAGVVGTDDVSYAGGTASFADRNVGSGKTVTASGLTLAGTDAGNYTVNSTATTAADITARPITVTAATNTKVYDGTTSAAATPGITGGSLATGDAANFTQHYADRNAGTGKTLIAAGAVNDGNGGANYLVTFVDDTTGVITPKALTLAAATDTKVYDGTTASGGTVTASGLVGGDTLGGLSQRFASKNVLGANGSTLQVNAGYVVSDGNGGANYTVTTNTAPGTITPASLLITADDKSRPFGAPNPLFTASYAGFVAGETAAILDGTLSFLTAATTSSAPGGYAITPFGQTSGNYAITYVDGTLTVVPTSVRPGGGGETAADQQAIGAQYTSRGMPDDVLTRVRYVFGDDECKDVSGTTGVPCAGGSAVRMVNGGILLPRQ